MEESFNKELLSSLLVYKSSNLSEHHTGTVIISLHQYVYTYCNTSENKFIFESLWVMQGAKLLICTLVSLCTTVQTRSYAPCMTSNSLVVGILDHTIYITLCSFGTFYSRPIDHYVVYYRNYKRTQKEPKGFPKGHPKSLIWPLWKISQAKKQ